MIIGRRSRATLERTRPNSPPTSRNAGIMLAGGGAC